MIPKKPFTAAVLMAQALALPPLANAQDAEEYAELEECAKLVRARIGDADAGLAAAVAAVAARAARNEGPLPPRNPRARLEEIEQELVRLDAEHEAVAPGGPAPDPPAVPPPPAGDVGRLRELLGAEDVREVAWGAHYTAERSEEQVVPDLVAALDRMAEAGGRRHLTVYTLLDALIRCEATIDPAHLEPFLSYGDPALLLLLRRPDRSGRSLLRLFRENDVRFNEPQPRSRTLLWRATGAALTNSRAPGFAAGLLRRAVQRITVVATTDGGGRSGEHDAPPPDGFSERGAIVTSEWAGSFEFPEGYPPQHRHRVSVVPAPGDVVVQSRPPIFARRIEVSSSLADLPSNWRFAFNTQEPIWSWLTIMAGMEDDERCRWMRRSSLSASDAADVTAEVDRLVAEAHAGYAELLVALVHAEALTPEEIDEVVATTPVWVHVTGARVAGANRYSKRPRGR